jgi:hypothetical protein
MSFYACECSFHFSRSSVELLLVFVVLAVGNCQIMPAYQALQADMISREKRGRIMGTTGTLNVMETIPASTLAGLLYSLDPA